MTIALIAGTGSLPPVLVEALMAQGRVPVVCEMAGFASEVTADVTRVPFRLETLGTLIKQLKALDVTELCLAGAVRRPVIDPSAIDALTAPLVPKLIEAIGQGDDGALRGVIALFEAEGFRMIGAHQIAPFLLPDAGVPTKAKPPELSADIAVAVTALAEMGRADMGQALIVRNGHVIAREDDRGTDALLSDFYADDSAPDGSGDPIGAALDLASDLVGGVADWLSGTDHTPEAHHPGHGAFLYKAPKPGQLLIADMPTIGVTTAQNAARAGLDGIVVTESGVMVMDATEVIRILDAHDMYLWVCP